QRMPALLNWQVQLTTLQLARQPEIKQLLGDTERLTRSTESFAQLADKMPSIVDEQRQAAIEQVLNGLASERTNLLTDFSSEKQQVRELLADARQTLGVANEAAASIDTATKSVHEFV